MATTINADTSTGGAIVTGDASGQLALQAAGVTKLTVSSSGVTLATPLPVASGGTGGSATPTSGGVAFGNGSAQAYTAAGTSGQYLQSAGSGTPVWATLAVTGSGGTTASGNVTLTSASAGAQYITPTAWGQYVALPDATTMTKAATVFMITNNSGIDLKIKDNAGTTKGFISGNTTVTIGLADNSTAAGTWVINGAKLLGVGSRVGVTTTTGVSTLARFVALDTDRDMYFVGNSGTIYAIVLNKTTNTWGSITTIRTGSTFSSAKVSAIKTATDQVLCISISGTNAMEAVVLTTSGTTITVGTAATATLSASFAGGGTLVYPLSLVLAGSTVVMGYKITALACVRAFTISGTTVTIGAQVTTTGIDMVPRLFVASSSVVYCLAGSSSVAYYPQTFSISGTTLTKTQTESQATNQNVEGAFTAVLGSRFIWLYASTGNVLRAAITTVTGTATSTNISGTLIPLDTDSAYMAWVVGASKVTVTGVNGTNAYVNTFTDNAGTPSIGSVQTLSGSFGQPTTPWASGTNQVSFVIPNSNQYAITFNADISGTSPVVTFVSSIYVGATASNNLSPIYYSVNTSNYPSALANSTSLFATGVVGGYYAWSALFTPTGPIYVPPTASNNLQSAFSSDGKYVFGTSPYSGTTGTELYLVEMAQ